MTAPANPLLDFSGLPRFDAIRAEHVIPAIDALLAESRAAAERVATEPAAPDWDNLVRPLAEALDRLDRAWAAVAHLNAVVSSPALRDAYNDALPRVTAFFSDLGQDERLFSRYRALAASPAHASLDAAQRRMIANELRDFRLGGAGLPAADKAQLKAAREQLATLTARFMDNVLDATSAYALDLDDATRLAGVPADVVAEARARAAAAGRPGYRLTLRMPCYLPVLQYADDRALRAELHRARATLASDLGADPSFDNTAAIARILELRRDVARLLGYRSYAELSLVPKMAGSPAEVLAFLRDLARRMRPYAERDYAELAAYARDTLGLADFAAWDLAYAREKLKAARYAFSDEEVRQYFPEDRVLAGLFRLVETIYGVTIRAGEAAAWHEDVRFFRIHDAAGVLAGEFYLDLYAREHKQGGAWMDDAINRRASGAAVRHPVAYVTCNLAAPVGGRPALFSHREIVTIFHEFGHALHLLLTRVDVPGVSGIEGVEWDAVELPSQLMENFCWEREVLRGMSAHAGTGAPLPDALFDRMFAAKNFGSGLETARQLELALFDMVLHAEYAPGEPGPYANPDEVLDAVRREVAVAPKPAYDRFMHGFGHVFGGGYAAGYYSYKWAEVLSADAYALFEELGVLSPVAGARFRDEVLARGGSRPAIDSFVAFRGRPPQIDALLRHNGMTMSS